MVQIVEIGSHAFASLKSKASNIPKIRREKKAKQEPELEIHEPIHSETVQPPVTEGPPTLQPLDIPRPVHAPKTQTATAPVDASVPVLELLHAPRSFQVNEVQQATQSAPIAAPAPTLQPFDIPRPIHAKQAPATAAVPTLQPFDIPRPVHAKKGTSPTKKDNMVPATTPPVTQPAESATQANEPVSQIQNPIATNLAYPPRSTHPLFPPAPVYGPPSLKSRILHSLRQLVSNFLSGIGIFLIIIAYLLHSLKTRVKRLISISPTSPRPFQAEEDHRAELRKIDSIAWTKRQIQRKSAFPDIAAGADVEAHAGDANDGFVPTEGGPDKFLVDVGYYARRVGLDCEDVKVQTEDGFILDMWHVYDPREYTPLSRAQRMVRGPECIDDIRPPSREPPASENAKDKGKEGEVKKQKYPVLLMPGLMQSSGVYCSNDDHSLAFWLCKQGFDVWLGNNRCGFDPQHVDYKKSDPRMWNWNIQHMATLDLPALTARVLSETSSPKLGLVAHSQGTTQTLIALSKHQRPSISSKLSVFCALAPAAYAGPLLNQYPFKFLRIIPTSLFRLTLGIKSFLPSIALVGHLQNRIPQSWIGGASYKVYNYLFAWGDHKWDRGVRDRNFLFAPTRISAFAMQWWLSRDGFAHHGSILSSHEQVQREVEEDLLQDYFRNVPGKIEEDFATELLEKHVREPRAPESWFTDGVSDEGRIPPMALWIAGDDTLCNGRELLNRFERGREPGVRVLEDVGGVIDGYSHLDVVWACDVIEKVGLGIRDAIWRTVVQEGRERYRVPSGVESLACWVDDRVDGMSRRDSQRSEELEDSESEKEREAAEKRVVGDKEMVD